MRILKASQQLGHPFSMSGILLKPQVSVALSIHLTVQMGLETLNSVTLFLKTPALLICYLITVALNAFWLLEFNRGWSRLVLYIGPEFSPVFYQFPTSYLS